MSARARLRGAIVALLERVDVKLRKRAARAAWRCRRRMVVADAVREARRRAR